MKFIDELILKYQSYLNHGNDVFAVTLSTFVKSEAFASKHFPTFWRNHFIERVLRQLPFKARRKLDHDHFIECSPDDAYHFHGFLALPHAFVGRIWANESLNSSLRRGLESFRSSGARRMFRMNDFLIEPVKSVAAWAMYCTKTSDARRRSSGQ